MAASSYAAFLAAAVVIIVVPGPTNLMIVSDSIHGGFRKALWTVLGAALSHAAFIVVTAAGLGAVMTAYPKTLLFIKWFGVAYLVLQGLRLTIQKAVPLESEKLGPKGRSLLGCLARGFVVNSTNPKALLFYAALFPPFVSPDAAFIPQLGVLATSFLTIFLVVGGIHALVGHRARAILRSRRSMTLANRISGGVMIGAAVWVAAR